MRHWKWMAFGLMTLAGMLASQDDVGKWVDGVAVVLIGLMVLDLGFGWLGWWLMRRLDRRDALKVGSLDLDSPTCSNLPPNEELKRAVHQRLAPGMDD